MRKGDLVRVTGVSISGGWAAELPVKAASGSPGVAALWARARIGELLDAERRQSEPDEIRTAIVETALTHHLVSKYTSLVAIDKTPVRPSNDPLISEQVPNLMPYGQSTNAIFGFPATATGAPLLRLTGLLSLLAAMFILTLLRAGGSTRRARCR